MKELRTIKRFMIITGVAWVLAVALGSWIDSRWDTWYAHVGAGLVRGIPLGLFVLGYLAYREVRRRTSTRKEVDT